MRILNNMILRTRTLTLILIMLALPLQGALAAIMPLCPQAKNTLAGLESQIHPIATAVPCNQHNIANHEHPVSNDSTANETAFNLSCDDIVCHINGNGLPQAASALNLAGGFSYTVAFNPGFTSSILPQPQRPPLA